MKSSNGAIISIVLCLLLIPGMLFASTLRISWNNNNESDLAGYKVYYGNLSGAYGHVLDVGDSVSVDIGGIEEDTAYFFAVTAYDLTGNESAFSREISVYVHSGQTGTLSAIINWIISSVSGSDPASDSPQYTLSDFTEISDSSTVATTTSMVQIDDSSVESVESSADGDYIVKDVITEVDQMVDLSTLYHTGTYYLTALSSMPCEIVDGVIHVTDPGAYLFMVQDSAGDPVDVLRISVVDELCGAAEYVPETGTAIDISEGISLVIPQSASDTAFSMGVDCGGASSYALSAVSVKESSRVIFDIVPYGLVLAEPAQISVLYDGSAPVVVEVFDEATRQWSEIEDVTLSDGVVTFSTTMLGSFKVYTPAAEDSSNEVSYESSGGGGCFINTLQNIRAGVYPVSLGIFLAMVMIGIMLHVVVSRKRY